MGKAAKNKQSFSKEQIDEVAEYLKGQGRKGDNELVHMTRGEIVLPKSVIAKLDPEVLADAFKAAGRDVGRYTVGQNDDSINPRTGLREYSDGSQGDGAGNDSAGSGGATSDARNSGGSTGGSTSDPMGDGASYGGDNTGSRSDAGKGAETAGGSTQDPMGDASTYGGDKTGQTSNAGKGNDYADPMGDAEAYGGDNTGARTSLGQEVAGTYAEDALSAQYSPRDLPTRVSDYIHDLPNIFADKISDIARNPLGFVTDLAIGAARVSNPALAAVTGLNTLSSLVGGPTIGGAVQGVANGQSVGQATGLASLSQSIADALNGVSVPTNDVAPNPNNPDPTGGARGGDGNPNTVADVRATEAATGQAATTLGNTDLSDGTTLITSTAKRRAFSQLSLGSSAGTHATMLW